MSMNLKILIFLIQGFTGMGHEDTCAAYYSTVCASQRTRHKCSNYISNQNSVQTVSEFLVSVLF